MGHKRIGDNDDGYKYAMAVMKYFFQYNAIISNSKMFVLFFKDV